MNPADTAKLLKFVSAFDNRTVTPEATVAWTTALQDVELGEAQQAVAKHYEHSEDWLMPARLREAVGEIRSQNFTLAVQTHSRTGDRPASCFRCKRHELLGYPHGCVGDPCRHCPWPGCSCTHTDGCDRGALDLGDIGGYDTVRLCPQCQEAAATYKARKLQSTP